MIVKCLILITMSLSSALSQADDTHLWEGTDIVPLISYFQTQVRVMKQSIYVHHWSHSGLGGEGEAYLNAAQRMSQSFWSHYGEPGGVQNMYGYGLYAAMDPVATNGFGLTEPWSLLELKIPEGLKVLDLTLQVTPMQADQKNAIEAIQTKFSCPTFENINDLFVNGGKSLAPNCQNLIRHIFKDVLPIGGFFYDYDQSDFRACTKAGDLANRAIVVTDPSWLKGEYVKFFNKQSLHAKNDRIRIQTLFLEERKSQVHLSSEGKSLIVQFLTKNPQKHFVGSRSVCALETCGVSVRFCDVKNICDELEVGAYPRPGGPTITNTEALKTDRRGLLWSDLEGAPKFPTTTEWLHDYTFGCSGRLPYSEPNQN